MSSIPPHPTHTHTHTHTHPHQHRHPQPTRTPTRDDIILDVTGLSCGRKVAHCFEDIEPVPFAYLYHATINAYD